MTLPIRPAATPEKHTDGKSRVLGYPHTCADCGRAFHSPKRWADFCGEPCRKTFNRRRTSRGLILIDLFMTLRFERPLAKKLGIWALMCRCASHWRAEDKALRNGRKSWTTPQAADPRLTEFHATSLPSRRKR